MPMDLLVRTPEHVEERIRMGDFFMQEITEQERFFMKPITREWVNKAEEDWEAARTLARKRKNPAHNAVCFHAQQSAEKYLKA